MARENPHCGNSGVPFINKTTGDVVTALSNASFNSVDINRDCWKLPRKLFNNKPGDNDDDDLLINLDVDNNDLLNIVSLGL